MPDDGGGVWQCPHVNRQVNFATESNLQTDAKP